MTAALAALVALALVPIPVLDFPSLAEWRSAPMLLRHCNKCLLIRRVTRRQAPNYNGFGISARPMSSFTVSAEPEHYRIG
jgi:hypothetical protein